MQTEDYFRSLSSELTALRDRVRYIISNRHWLTDGEWKESILRAIIKRNAPATVSVGRGFIVTNNGCSSQLDILIYDNSHPVIYKDGDLVFISPAACRAIIEVKSRITPASFRGACNQLADVANFVRNGQGGGGTFVGLFSYEKSSSSLTRFLENLAASANGSDRRVIDHVVLGPSHFFKWWNVTPEMPRRNHQMWHAYELNNMAAGYFIHNLLMHLSPHSEQVDDAVWFPEQSKEANLVDSKRLIELPALESVGITS